MKADDGHVMDVMDECVLRIKWLFGRLLPNF